MGKNLKKKELVLTLFLHFKSFIYFFIIYFLLNCSATKENGEEANQISLPHWYLDIEERRISRLKVEAAPIETQKTEEGVEIGNYDGVFYYTVRFSVPPHLKNESLAFYSEGIDDADETYLNGRLIGKTGMIPKSPSVSLKDFRSAAREARLYELPNLKFDSENELKIKVYDYAGLGGFSPKQIPVIGSVHTLKARARNHLLLNDLPRTLGGCFLIIFLILYTGHFISLIPVITLSDVGKSIFAPFQDFFRDETKGKYKFSIETHIASRYLLSVLFCFFCLLFLLTEVTYKYLLIESEEFYFKIPTLGFAIGQCVLQLLFYPDVFGSGIVKHTSRIIYSMRFMFSILTHPLWTFLFFIYLLFLPPNQVWNEFTVNGMVNLFIVITLLFTASAWNLLYFGFSEHPLKNKKAIKAEGIFRASIFLGILLSVFLWFYTKELYSFSFLMMIFFLALYMIKSLIFISKNRILLPIEINSIFTLLQKKYKLTVSESEIAQAVYHGLSRTTIKDKFKYTEENLKKYLNSIYKKVFTKHPDIKTTGRDKLQRLTVILQQEFGKPK